MSDPPVHTLKEFSEQSLREEKDLHEVVVQFDREMVRYMGDQKYHRGWVSEEEINGRIEMTFLTASVEYFARWLLIWGDGVTIKTPDRLKIRMGELSEGLYQHYHK